ncbi:MAG TPA: hypothetical protein VK845_08750, partial [Gemmatimonadales bacterium]|nr:hypothetical protein [Gemmatimonadales bacterium]
LTSVGDVLLMRNLSGGGPGCAYPNPQPTQRRRIYHQLVLFGFVLAFLATVMAAAYQDIFGILPPYDLLSAPVVLGTVGGLGMVVGCVGLLAQKSTAPIQRISRPMRTMDIVFMAALLAVNVTGLILLALRETALMGLLLAAHLGVTAGLFAAMPYGKFSHLVYRYLALLRNRTELAEERRRSKNAETTL